MLYKSNPIQATVGGALNSADLKLKKLSPIVCDDLSNLEDGFHYVMTIDRKPNGDLQSVIDNAASELTLRGFTVTHACRDKKNKDLAYLTFAAIAPEMTFVSLDHRTLNQRVGVEPRVSLLNGFNRATNVFAHLV